MSSPPEPMEQDALFEDELEEGSMGYETTTRVSMETELPESNIGYKLLQKMGWRAGQGLGPSGQGKETGAYNKHEKLSSKPKCFRDNRQN